MGNGDSKPAEQTFSQSADQSALVKMQNTTAMLKQVSLSVNKVCGVPDNEKEIYCAPADAKSDFQWEKKDRGLHQIALDLNTDGKTRGCGVNKDHDIWCADDMDNPTWIQIGKPPVNIVQLDISGNTVCGVSDKNEILCSFYKLSNWNTHPGQLSYISLSGSKSCGVGIDSFIYCTDIISHMDPPVWMKVENAQNFTQIDLSENTMCAVDNTGTYSCAEYNKSNWVKYGSNVKSVSVQADPADSSKIRMYIVDTNNHVTSATK